MKLHIEERNLEKKSNIYIVHENGLKVGRINNMIDAETIVKRVNGYDVLLNDYCQITKKAASLNEENEGLQLQNRELAESINEFKVIFTELIGVFDLGVYKEHLQYHIDRAEKILREIKGVE